MRIRCCLRYNVDTYMHKSRIISDCKRSGVSAAATRTHKSALPRVTDAAQSALELMDLKAPDQDIVLFIADIVDAFWLIPFHMSERRYFCAQLRRKWCTHTHTRTHTRTAQGSGSRMAPLTFAAVTALALRWVQSLGTDFRLQTYVDEAVVALKSTPDRIKRVATVIATHGNIGNKVDVD